MSLPAPVSVCYALLCFLFLRAAYAQLDTIGQCNSGFDYLNNEDNLNPCIVGAYAFSACSSTDDVLSATYDPPSGDGVTSCGCSSVTYSLLTACSLCQDGEEIDWNLWTWDCPDDLVSNGEFPDGVEMGVDIPVWASSMIFGEFTLPSDGNALPSSTSSSSTSPTTSESSTRSTLRSPSIVPMPTSTITSPTSVDLVPNPSSQSLPSSSSSPVAPVSRISPGVTPGHTSISYTTKPNHVTPSPAPLWSSSSSVAPSNSTSPVRDSGTTSDTHKSNLALIIGGAVGGAVVLALVVGLAAFSLHVRRKQQQAGRTMAPYRVDGWRLYDPEDEATYPKPEWRTASGYSDRELITQMDDPGHRLVPNRPPLIPEVY